MICAADVVFRLPRKVLNHLNSGNSSGCRPPLKIGWWVQPLDVILPKQANPSETIAHEEASDSLVQSAIASELESSTA